MQLFLLKSSSQPHALIGFGDVVVPSFHEITAQSGVAKPTHPTQCPRSACCPQGPAPGSTMAKKKGKSVCHPLPRSTHLHHHGHCRDKNPHGFAALALQRVGSAGKKTQPNPRLHPVLRGSGFKVPPGTHPISDKQLSAARGGLRLPANFCIKAVSSHASLGTDKTG